MKEHLFVMKKGTEVPVRFDGATVPIMAPSSNEEMIALAGDKAYVIFNRAFVLDVQKSVKVESNKEGATVESLRKHAADYKIGEVRTRSTTGTGAPRVSANAVERALGDDLLATFTPEQRALFESKKEQLKAAAKKAPAAATEAAPAEVPAAPATERPKARQR